MRLAKVTLSGFKSFADRTEFAFDAPVTGIVGPNGCGKSNVVDAIKWVLGERSAKSLRGKEMEDVIFAGSAGRKPMGMASVVLSFENPALPDDHWLRRSGPAAIDLEHDDADAPADEPAQTAEAPSPPALNRAHRRGLNIDAETVDIERRLHRDGASEYLINGRKARLRDIRDLFLDTGVGADAYCIIEQGKVDAMLLASPTERRSIFEEAAGIAKFRARRVESERKLERAEANLVRAREQLDSTERRLRIVKGQAAKARQYKELDARLRERRTALALDQYHDLRQRLDGLTSQLSSLEGARRDAASRLRDLEENKQHAEIRRHELLNQRQAAEHDKAQAEHAAHSAEQRRALTERTIAESRQQMAAEESRLAALEAQSRDLADAAETAAAAGAELRDQAAAGEARVNEAASARSAAQSSLAGRRADAGEKRSQASDIERRRAAVLADAEGERRRAEGLTEQLRRLHDRAAVAANSRAALAADLEACLLSAADRAGAAEGLDADVARLDIEASSLSGDHRALSERLGELEHERVRLDSRRATLHEMIEARAGLGDAARHVLALAHAGDPARTGVIAPLAECIRVDTAHAPAVEAALGPALQALVVESLASLADGAALRDLPGRVTFVPLRGSAAPPFIPSAAEHDLLRLAPHRLTPVRALVDADARTAPALDALLGRTYLVDCVDAAMLLLAGPMASLGARFVTRAGEVIEPDGRITAGPMTGEESGRGLLERRAEHADLEARLADLTALVERQRAAVASLDQRLATVSSDLGARRAALAEIRRALAADDARRERLAAELARADRDAASLADETAAAETRLQRLAEERGALLTKAESLARLAEEHAASLKAAETEVESLQAQVDAHAEALTAAKIASSQASERLAAAEREARRLAAAREENARDARHAAEQLAFRRERLAEHHHAVEECARQIDAARTAAADAEVRLISMATDLLAATEDARRLAEATSLARDHAHAVERNWQTLEITRRELEVRRETLEERTIADLGLDLPRVYTEWSASASGYEPIDQPAFITEIDALRADIARLGNVNLDAIDEESQLESRNEDLIRQVADIDAARAGLGDLIRRLNDASRDRFRETFQSIEAQFAGKDGMFRRLFGGGRAELRLIPMEESGEIDWLESGVDVIAKPPGKEPRTISQLSGGEKTMTAVALLMSIFVSKPSPFCILDEVDAALDESNVGRFNAVVKQFLNHSHFIVITHNKRTMMEADQLFGVTMQERGVSRRVRVRFEDIGDHGHIKPSALKPDDEPQPDPASASPGSLRAALAAMRQDSATAAVSG